MRTIRKIITSSLFLALAVLVGGPCVFPMSSAQAAVVNPTFVVGMSADAHIVESHGCAEQGDGGCVSTKDQSHFGGCALSCASSVSKTGVIKKASDGLDILGSDVVLEQEVPATTLHEVAPGTLARSGSDPGILLSVAKKE